MMSQLFTGARARLSYLRRGLSGDWYAVRRGALMPEAGYKRTLLRRIQRSHGFSILVETGTFRGDTPAALHSEFDRIYTIELSPELYDAARGRLAEHRNVEVLLGDSATILPELMHRIDRPALFWLDGHFSSGDTAGDLAQNPVLVELAAIATSTAGPHAIAIDDASDFSDPAVNCRLSDVVRAIEDMDSGYRIFFDYDVLIALPDTGRPNWFWREVAPPVVVR